MSSAASRSSKENLPEQRSSLLRDVINDQQRASHSRQPNGRIKGTESLSGRVAAMVLKMERKSTVKAPMAQQESLDDEEKKRTKRRYMGSISGSKILQNIFTMSRKDDKKEPKMKNAGGSRIVAVSGAAAGEAMVFKDGCLDPVLRRSKTSADANSLGPVPVLIGGRLKKRQSESSIGTDATKNRRLSLAVPPPPKLLPRPHSAVVALPEDSSRPKSSHKDKSPVRRRALPPEKSFTNRKQPAAVGRKVSPSPPELKASVAEVSPRIPQISITPAGRDKAKELRNLESFELLWRQDRKVPMPSRGLSRTMTYVESKILPPLYETDKPNEDVESVTATIDAGKKKLRKYGGSHTTSTYQGKKDTAPDASARRHLIGFLHRTSHLSLTSELSGTASFYLIGHRGRRFEDSTLGSESDARVFSDEDDRGSTTTDLTSVSRQHDKYRRRQKRRNYRKPSRASSFSSITESSMSLDVITVTLNMDPVNFLGISIVGQSGPRGDNGIYVANIIKGGAVALDGRIEAGDMILQVNDISFENFTNDQAVDVLKDAVQKKGPIKLTVAKQFNQGPKSHFTIPRNHRDEPVRPIDPQAWIAHTNAMCRGMPSILEGSEGAPTPVPGDWPHVRPPSQSTVNSGGSGGQATVIGKLSISTDKKKIVQALAMPDSGLDIRDRSWLKIPIPNSFLGSDLVSWLLEKVEGLRDRKESKKFASELLRLKYITQMVAGQMLFIEQRYYSFGPECAEFLRYRTHPEELQHPSSSGWTQWQKNQAPASMVSGYASMPVSPFPHMIVRAGGPDVRSQASGGSGDGSGSGSDHKRRQVLLPPAPPSSARLDDFPMEMAASRQSFRQAMNQPINCEFFIDHL